VKGTQQDKYTKYSLSPLIMDVKATK